MNKLDDLILRMGVLLADEDNKTTLIHWSDIETLKALKLELEEAQGKLTHARDSILEAMKALIQKSDITTP